MGRNKSKQARRAEQWAKEHKRINWDVVWKVLASGFAFAGSMVAVYELVNYFRSDSKTFYSIIFPGLGIIVWSVILFQLFRKKNSYAILLLAFTVIGGIVGGIGWRSYNRAQEDKVIVLVAQFDGPEETYGLHDQIMEDLRQATKGYDDTEIIDGNDVVTSGQGSEYARELGKKVKADLVIWAWYRPTENPNITVHIENLSPTQIETLQESETYQPQATLADLESFEIQRKLGSETSTLVSFLAGLLRYKAGDYQIALQRFEQIAFEDDISTYIEPRTLYFYIGDLYGKLGEFELSIQGYDKTIELDPKNMGAHNNRGTAYYALEQYERAIDDFDKAIELNPNNLAIYYNRALVYEALKQYERAIEDYDKAIELDPSSAMVYTGRGVAYYELQQYKRAIEDYDKAIELDPNNAMAYSDRGLAYRALEQFEYAFEDYNKAIELDPNNPIDYYNRALAYKALKQYERAIDDFDTAIELDPQYANAYHDRGLTYQQLGKTAEAEADFKKYEELTGQKP